MDLLKTKKHIHWPSPTSAWLYNDAVCLCRMIGRMVFLNQLFKSMYKIKLKTLRVRRPTEMAKHLFLFQTSAVQMSYLLFVHYLNM